MYAAGDWQVLVTSHAKWARHRAARHRADLQTQGRAVSPCLSPAPGLGVNSRTASGRQQGSELAPELGVTVKVPQLYLKLQFNLLACPKEITRC